KYTFLVGAGCSVDAPSCLPAGKPMMKAIIEHSCVESEVEKIIAMENLRFEQLVEIVRDELDPNLKIIDYYGLCDKSNSIHSFLAEMISLGHFVITTNFDYLIEYALLELGIIKEHIIPVITKEDFDNFSDPDQLVRLGRFPVYKIHGSPHNIITDKDTKDSLVATIQAFGSGKEGESVFQLEPHKRLLFENITEGRSLVVMGYSGSDDFDIVPTLKLSKGLKQILWIDHTSDNENNSVQQIDSDSKIHPKDKVGKILREIYQTGFIDQLFRIRMNTASLGTLFSIQKMKMSAIPFQMDIKLYLSQEIDIPDEFLECNIPLKIYYEVEQLEDVGRCSQTIIDRARSSKNLKWEAEGLNNKAVHLQMKGESEEALRILREALRINEQLDWLFGMSECLNNIGWVYYEMKRMDDSLVYYKKALAIDRQRGDKKKIGTALNNIGMILYQIENLEEALPYIEESLIIAENLGNVSSKATYLNNIGLILHGKGKINEALSYYKEAIAIVEQLRNLRRKVIYLTNMGKLLRVKGELDEALSCYTEALDITEQQGYLREKASTLHKIGLIFYDQTKYEQALHYFEKSAQIKKDLGSSSKNIEATMKWVMMIKSKLSNSKSS
ncbi:MAG: tetratricopeptide repeat protein, partial [Promethearchaeota archaeon]